MPNETVSVNASEGGHFFTYDDFTASPDSTVHYWQGVPPARYPRWQQIDDNINPVLRSHQFVAFEIPLDGDNVIVKARLIYKSNLPSTLAIGEFFSLIVRGYDIDDWFLPDDGPESNIEGITIWNTLTTSAEVEVDLHVTSGDIEFAVADVEDPLQEIMNRAGWVKDNKAVFLIKTDDVITTTAPELIGCKQIAGTELVDYKFARLEIEYYYEPLPPGYDKHIWQTLEIEHSPEGENPRNDIEDTIEFEEDILGVHDRIRDVEQTLRFFETVSFYVTVVEVEYEDLLFFTEDIIGSRSSAITLEDDLILDQDISGDTYFQKNTLQELLFEEDIDYTRSYPRSLEDVVSFTDENTNSPGQAELTQQLTITQTIEIEAIVGTVTVEHTITFEEDFDENTIINSDLEDTLTLTQTILAYMESSLSVGEACGRFDLIWKPFTSEAFPNEPTITKRTIFLQYNDGFTLYGVDLPAPNFTDREELSLTRIQRKTRGGDLKTFSDDQWPKVRTFRYKFDNLTLELVEEFHTFLNQSLGRSITLIDHENRQWNGYIVNPQGEAANFARTCGSTTEFDFDGVEV
jgi:hypothetical protein